MGPAPPYLLDPSASVTVEADPESTVALLTVHGTWDQCLGQAAATALRHCLAEHPGALIVDLSALDDPAAHSAAVWTDAQRTAAAMQPPVQLALCVPPEMILADRLQRLGARRFLPVYARVRQARVAVSGRLPMTERLVLALGAEPDASALAGSVVAGACAAWRLDTLLHRGRTVVAELVGNAVRHGEPPITVVVSRRTGGLHGAGGLHGSDGLHRSGGLHGSDGLHLAVADTSPRRARLSGPDGPGRGLHTVHRAATAWGALPTATGKVVWATLHPDGPPVRTDDPATGPR